MPTDEEPLPSANLTPGDAESADESDASGAEDAEESTSTSSPAAPARPPMPTFKLSTFVIIFLGMLGFLMLVDTPARNQIATLLGVSPAHNGPLYFAIGFGSSYLLLTMAIAGAVEMLITAVAYNYTTDWIKAAKVQKWSAAFRKVQMDAIRSGKKDRISALKPHQEKLTRLSSEISIAQFKGMAITWFLLILIYTWVGIVIEDAAVAAQTISLGGTIVNIYTYKVFNYFPIWFFIFSLYTIPLSLVFRRILKNYWLRRYLNARGPPSAPSLPGTAGGAA